MISAVRSAIRGQSERWAVFRVVAFSGTLCGSARVAKLVDAADLKSAGGNSLPVRFRSRAPHETAARRFFVFPSAGRTSTAPRGAGAAVQGPPVAGRQHTVPVDRSGYRGVAAAGWAILCGCAVPGRPGGPAAQRAVTGVTLASPTLPGYSLPKRMSPSAARLPSVRLRLAPARPRSLARPMHGR